MKKLVMNEAIIRDKDCTHISKLSTSMNKQNRIRTTIQKTHMQPTSPKANLGTEQIANLKGSYLFQGPSFWGPPC